MFFREFVVKGFVHLWGYVLALTIFGPVAIISWLTLPIVWLVDHLWPLWDKNNQALHDKVARTVMTGKPTGKVNS